MATQTLTAAPATDLGPVREALQLPLISAVLQLLPAADRARELQLMDEADEARWLDAALSDLDAEYPDPPF